MNFTVERLEFFVLIVVRMSGFIFTAPLFSMPNIPRKIKAAISIFISILLFQTISYTALEYVGVIGYAVLVVKELVVGILIGYLTNICTYILNFSGQIIDMDIGFSMVNLMNPTANMTTTISGNLYTYFVTLMLLVTNMHHYILKAMVDAFTFVPVGKIEFHSSLYGTILKFMADYLVIGFRIVLPMFAAILIVNVVLGVLAKVAPQMNMFVIGMQLKVFVGLFMLGLMIRYLPQVSEFIFEEMKTMMRLAVQGMTPGK